MFRYSIALLRAIEEACSGGNTEGIYGGIELLVKGYMKWKATNLFNLAEYKVDFERALKHMGRKAGEKLSYKELKAMCEFLNGEG